MKVDLLALNDRVNSGLISMRKHPEANLRIWNYTQACQFSNAWDEYTESCRGLITDLDGNVVARPFPKFFNVGQRPETCIEALPAEVPFITEKMDGSLGILYWFEGKPYIATRGSFESEQALWATTWLQSKPVTIGGGFLPEYTYIFEILYPANRIVVDYRGRSELVLLAVIETETGLELDLMHEAKRIGFSYAPIIPPSSISELLKTCETLPGNEEGFVAKYSNGLRVKMKGAEYSRLHRIVTNCSARRVWECLSSGMKLEDWLDRVPDELFAWADETRGKLLEQFNSLRVSAMIAYLSAKDEPTRKDQAAYILSKHKDVSGLAFLLLDGKSIDAAIWKQIRPLHETPFKVSEDEDA